MKLGVLFSGGKDSVFACYKAMQANDVVCLITITSENLASYMFHTPNIGLTKLQAKAIGLPLMNIKTKGVKEEELEDLEKAIQSAKKKYKIDGIVTGAIQSVYQASRIKKICDKLKLECINPLWQVDQKQYMGELISAGFKVIISGVASYPFTEEWLGKEINDKTISELLELNKKYKITLSGEGGEFESLVLDCPIFKKRIEIVSALKEFENYAGVYKIEKAKLVEK